MNLLGFDALGMAFIAGWRNMLPSSFVVNLFDVSGFELMVIVIRKVYLRDKRDGCSGFLESKTRYLE